MVPLILSRVKPAVSGLLLGLLCSAAGADVVIEVGPNFVGGKSTDSVTLMLQNRWQNKWIASIGYITQQSVDTCGRPDCEWEIDGQWMAGGERLFTWRRISFGVGLYYIEDVHRISSTRINGRLSLEYAATEHIAIKLSHISNAGIGEEIEICNELWCYPPKKYNPGIDALMLVWKF